MPRRAEIGAVQLYPQRPLKNSDKNGYVLKFYCPILGKRVRKNCGTRDRREARRVQRECRERLLNGQYVVSGGAITAMHNKVASVSTSSANSSAPGKPWQECYEHYLKRFKGRSIDDTVSRLSVAERIFEGRRKDQGLPAGITIMECLNDEGIEYLQDRLLAGDGSRFDSRAAVTVNSIVRRVMTFARFCRRKKWVPRLPEVERLDDGDAMKGRPVTGEEFERMLDVVPKVVGAGPAESWRFTLRVLWESTFRVGDVMDFSWDDPQHIYPVWPHRSGLHPTLVVPSTQKNRKNQEIPMLPGLAELLKQVPVSEMTGWVVNPLTVEYQMKSQGDNWFMPARSDLETLAVNYSNSTIARACGVSETTVRKWLKKLAIHRQARVRQPGVTQISPVEVDVMRSRAAKRHTHLVRRGGGRLTKERVSRIISMIGETANVVVCQSDEEAGRRIKYASAHDLRRGGAVRLINAGVSAESLQVIMRHEDFATTQKFYGAKREAQRAAAEVYQKLLVGDDKKSELVGGLMGGLSERLGMSPEQLRKLKALLNST